MVPIRLNLRNFLCYGDTVPTLDLSSVHVACLCGQNGHGKSALLDAITWVLWGKARGKSQDELVRFGFSEMMVDLEFQSRDALYKVIRRHSNGGTRGRHGVSDLQLQVQSEDGFSHPVTGNTIRETQVKIDQIVGMDYDTFINSAFLLQGRADEFTNKRPGERKEILGKILDLAFYDRVQDRAKSVVSEKRGLAGELERELGIMSQRIDMKAGLETELSSVGQELEKAKYDLDKVGEKLVKLKNRLDSLKSKAKELVDSENRKLIIIGELANANVDIESLTGLIQDEKDLIVDKKSIRQGRAQYQQARESYENLTVSRTGYESMMERKASLEGKIQQSKVRMEEQIRNAEQRIANELQPKADRVISTRIRLVEAQEQLNAIYAKENLIGQQRVQGTDLASRLGELKANETRLVREGSELKSKIDIMDKSAYGARCPVCESELGIDECNRLLDSYKQDRESKLYDYNANSEALAEVEKQLSLLEGDLASKEAEIRYQQRETQSNINRLELELNDYDKSAAELALIREEIRGVQSAFSAGAYASEVTAEVSKIEQDIERLGYDPHYHQRLYDDMGVLLEYDKKYQRLLDAENRLPKQQDALDRAWERKQRLQYNLETTDSSIMELKVETGQLDELTTKVYETDKEHQMVVDKERDLVRKQAVVEGDLRNIYAVEEQLSGVVTRLKKIQEEASIYHELAEAFGKKGVQAMLIDTVLPRLEEEANALLGRMTDNQMHLRLESQRQRRDGKGDPMETLDIIINDEVGPRSYELFSGGEAFRINLALRIALSKVLAYRKGASLPTLFIDEGFGTQDSSGRERIIDVIRSIEEDFQKIIVITHMEELKDAFETRIEVSKGDMGSTFAIY